jgi:hypothetical protein
MLNGSWATIYTILTQIKEEKEIKKGLLVLTGLMFSLTLFLTYVSSIYLSS